MKTAINIIYKEPDTRDPQPARPGMPAVVIVAAIVYALSFIGRTNGLSPADCFIIPALTLLSGCLVYRRLVKRKKK